VVGDDGRVREFARGYDDWPRQASLEAAPLAPASSALPEQKRPPKERPRKMSFNDQRELEALPERILALEQEQETLHAAMADPGFYKNAAAGVVRINTRLAELEQELAIAYQRWEELESLKNPV